MKDIYTSNYKTSQTKNSKIKIKREVHALDWKSQYSSIVYSYSILYRFMYKFSTILVKVLLDILHNLVRWSPNLYENTKDPEWPKQFWQRTKGENFYFVISEFIIKPTIIKTVWFDSFLKSWTDFYHSCLHEMFKKAKSIATQKRLVVAWGLRREWKRTVKGYEGCYWDKGNG